MPVYFEINKYAFLCGDYEYFQWFSKKTKETLEKVIKWKKLRAGKPDINKIWNEKEHDLDENAIKNLRFGIVTRAFLFHLKWPNEFPIFDHNVFKAMTLLENTKKKNITNKKDYDDYKDFFKKYYEKHKNEIENLNFPDLSGVPKYIIERKVLDRALWEFGRINAVASNF